jgi:hypothetical protein
MVKAIRQIKARYYTTQIILRCNISKYYYNKYRMNVVDTFILILTGMLYDTAFHHFKYRQYRNQLITN